jgi:hypothetical protein
VPRFPHPLVHGEATVANRRSKEPYAVTGKTRHDGLHGLVATLIDDENLGGLRFAGCERAQASVQELGSTNRRNDDRNRMSSEGLSRHKANECSEGEIHDYMYFAPRRTRMQPQM